MRGQEDWDDSWSSKLQPDCRRIWKVSWGQRYVEVRATRKNFDVFLVCTTKWMGACLEGEFGLTDTTLEVSVG